ncbi:MAG: class I SAM-dependent methyltransferase [Candidatus Krumholzibacteriia bacterium]
MSENLDAKAGGGGDDARRERIAQVAERIRETITLDSSARVLEFGAGDGSLGFQLLPHVGHVTFADTSPEIVERLQRRVAESRAGEAEAMQLQEKAGDLTEDYDAIVSLMALHRIEDYRTTVHNLADHLRPKGHLVLCDLAEEDDGQHRPDASVHTRFLRDEVEALLRACGLVDVDVSTPDLRGGEPPAAAGGDEAARGAPVILARGRKP